VLMRLALRTLRLFGDGSPDDAREYASEGAARLSEALALYADVPAQLEIERRAWGSYYDALDAIEQGMVSGDADLIRARDRAVAIIEDCRVAM
jgi:hypothetical protein